jgi:hypothetical protein
MGAMGATRKSAKKQSVPQSFILTCLGMPSRLGMPMKGFLLHSFNNLKLPLSCTHPGTFQFWCSAGCVLSKDIRHMEEVNKENTPSILLHINAIAAKHLETERQLQDLKTEKEKAKLQWEAELAAAVSTYTPCKKYTQQLQMKTIYKVGTMPDSPNSRCRCSAQRTSFPKVTWEEELVSKNFVVLFVITCLFYPGECWINVYSM